MNKKLRIILASVLSLTVIGGAVFLYVNQDKNTTNQDSSVSSNLEQQPAQSSQINFSEDGKTVDYTGVLDETALATLKALAQVETKESSYGEFVTTINGVTADESKEYWSFYVNGSYANEGAGTYKAKSGDNFQWKLESLQQ